MRPCHPFPRERTSLHRIVGSLLPLLFVVKAASADPVLGPAFLVDPATRWPAEATVAVARETSAPNYIVAFENILGCGAGDRYSGIGVMALPTSGQPASQGIVLDSVEISAGSVDGPDVAAVGSNYLVVWIRYDGSDGNIWGVRVDEAGMPTESPFLILDRAESFGRPSLVGLPDGSARVAAATSTGIYVNTVPSVGAPLSTAGMFVVAGGSPDMARDVPTEDIVLVYHSGSGIRCVAQFGGFGAWSPSVLVASGFSVSVAQVAAGGGRQFLAVFDILPRLYAARISTSGSVLSVLDAGGFAVESGTGQVLSPHVTHDGFNYQLCWTESFTLDVNETLWTARVTNGGAVLDGPPLAVRPGIDVVLEPAIGGESTPLIVWSEKVTYNPGVVEQLADLFGRRRNASGTFLDASPRRIWRDYHQDGGAAITRIKGQGSYAGYAVAWSSGQSAEPGAGFDIYVAHYDDDGVSIGMNEMLCGVPDNQFFPALANDGEDFVVAWFDQAGTDIRGVSSHDFFAGSPQGKLIWDGTALAYAGSPSLASNGTNYLLASPYSNPPSSSQIALALLDSDASVVATTMISRMSSNLTDPHVASDGDGYLVVFRLSNASDTNIVGRLVDAAGALVGSPISICAATGVQQYPAVAFDGANYVVAWQDSRAGGADIYAGRVTPGGTPLDGDGIPIIAATSDQAEPDVTHNGYHTMIVWSDPFIGTPIPRGAYMDFEGSVGPAFTMSNDLGMRVMAAGGHDGQSLAVWLGNASPDPGGWRLIARTVQDITVVSEDEAEGAAPPALRVIGSPGAGPFTLVSPGGGIGGIRIYDPGGRVVAHHDASGAPSSWTWDGRDAMGRPLPSGIYLVEAGLGRERGLRSRVVIVR